MTNDTQTSPTRERGSDSPATPAPAPTPTRPPFNALWASAFVLLALVLIQAETMLAQPFERGDAAQAGMVSQTGNLTVMTADGGADDLLLVLEGRTEELLVYRSDRNGVLLQQRLSVPKLFQDARAMSQGK
ncbi:MAG TPA: hypothetical protein VD997_02170 [Phycisphaerales bacterium]|nr:hypothetical protein [Phycisphaerales bacterium]